MRKSLFSLLLALLFTSASADTLTVKLDGTGDYTNIQTAIGWSSSGDVILVYPGTYYENIDCYGRDSLTIASLFLLNPVDSIIHNTIINANQTGSCISAFRGEENLRIIGLTMLNGSGTRFVSNLFRNGGGVLLSGVTASIEHCKIKDNYSLNGGGLFVLNSIVKLSSATISYNHAYGAGGGIFYSGNDLIFDSIYKCNLYLNTSQIGTDYVQSDIDPVPVIFLDTGTVIEPDRYYFSCTNSNGFQTCSFNFNISHAKIQEINSNIYVNPSGNDTNSGLTINDPLKTISFAILKIKSDSTRINTIFLSNGTYSSSNGNKFPISIKNSVPIIGENANNTIIDLDSIISFGFVNSGEKDICLKDFKVVNGMGDSMNYANSVLFIRNCEYALLDNMIFKQCSGKDNFSVLKTENCDSLFIKSSIFEENHVASCLSLYGSLPIHECYSEINSCIIQNNYPGLFQHYDNYGQGLIISNGMGSENIMTAKLINCQITDNFDGTSDPYYPATSGVAFEYNTIAEVINSTIGNNTSTNPNSGAVGIAQNSTVSFYNSVIYGNNVHQILMYNTEPDMGCHVNLYHSVIENGENGILNLSPYSTYYYDSTNLAEYPNWISSGDYPYALLNDSPCINAGTQVLPEGIILPDTDLMGGPRISGGEVDMGAYEFLFVGMDEYNSSKTSDYFQIAPNPFKDNLTIYFDNSTDGKIVELNLYDLQGKFIQSIFHGKVKTKTFIWSPGNGETLIKPGVYLLKFSMELSSTDSVKVILM